MKTGELNLMVEKIVRETGWKERSDTTLHDPNPTHFF
jgi:hypothetical protein